MKKIAQFLLLGFVFIGIILAAMNGHFQDRDSDEVGFEHSSDERSGLVVTYFTTDVRCVSCRKIEALTVQTIEERFAEELSNGSVVFHTKNFDREENKHYINDYDLSFKTVVISSIDSNYENKWKRMDDVWKLIDDPEGFKDYLASGIQEMIETQ